MILFNIRISLCYILKFWYQYYVAKYFRKHSSKFCDWGIVMKIPKTMQNPSTVLEMNEMRAKKTIVNSKLLYFPAVFGHFSPAPVKTDRAVRIQ